MVMRTRKHKRTALGKILPTIEWALIAGKAVVGAFLFAKSSALRYTNSIKIAVGGRGGIPHVQIAYRQVF